VNLNEEQAVVQLKKKRHHPVMMSALQALGNATVPWIHDRSLYNSFVASACSGKTVS
nr:hypothetical protein [Chlamydiota bacterium]